MIILIHGTEDDDTKSELWMQWVARILEIHGENVLVLPGIASPTYDRIGDRARAFLGEMRSEETANRPVLPSTPVDRELLKAIREGGKELHDAMKVAPFKEEETIMEMCSKTSRMGARFGSAQGIKLRAGVAAVCVLAYQRRSPEPTPIRIIGHSRGGSAAVALHNLVSAMGIDCNHTLVLDPVHGKRKLSHKAYYRVVYAGRVTCIPARKKSPTFADVEITSAAGGAVSNHPKLLKVEHGKMGKLTVFYGPESGKVKLRSDFQEKVENFIATVKPGKGLRKNLETLFARFLHNPYPDLEVIRDNVIRTLTDVSGTR